MFLILYIFCSVHVVSFFELSSVGFFRNYITLSEYKQLAIWGNYLFFIIFLLLNILLSFTRITKDIVVERTLPNKVQSNKINRYFIGATFLVFSLQFLTLVLGLAGDHFDAKTVLPFHLNGIIDEYRANLYPYIFAVFIYDQIIKGNKIKKTTVIIFVVYALLEMFVRNSKGAFVLSFLPVFIMLAFANYVNRKFVIKYILPLVIALSIMYPIIEQARDSGQLTVENLMSTVKKAGNTNEDNSSLYIRTFLTGIYYVKVKDVIDNDMWSFDFSNVPMLLGLRGGSAYMTRVIDGVPENVHHSSGVTGLCDGLLWGGYPMCFILVAIYVFMCFYGDNNRKMLARPPFRLILFFFFYTLVFARSFSFFIDSLFMSSIVSIIIKIMIAKYYYKKLV